MKRFWIKRYRALIFVKEIIIVIVSLLLMGVLLKILTTGHI
jgi:hypothetical protein